MQIGSVVNMIRRFSELKYVYKLSSEIGEKGIVVIDGSLQASYTGEDKIINEFGVNVCALAKSNNLFTRNGNNPCVYLNRLCSLRVWSYSLVPGVAFVKLDSRALHVFRFDGNIELLANLDGFCHDPLFLGYPYGLILVDKLARVSNVEKQSLRAQFLLLDEAKIFRDYLTTNNAHEILDTVF